MDRDAAIKEIDWYASLVRRKIGQWGRDLMPAHREKLLGNISDVAERRDSLQFVQYDDGYYIGQTDEEGLRQGYGILTRTTPDRNRWVMQAGFWQEDRPMGSHTLYDADAPAGKHSLASVYYSGERRRERGTVEFSVSAEQINIARRKYRRYEGFSASTMFVGLSLVYVVTLLLTRNSKIGLMVVIVVVLLYLTGSMRERR